ncbi:hypothetical protein Mtc_0356 [Methanocella conradii HZ254]|uniref:Uncharacterized protein n=1 Tax=Methanocella conradii (strain DSM 24694 / JCM 17849 / CGMCC 1.5162 / HZ254) TaxID=1041930 RepID=H8IA60_METCZ|nr:hypothetical protein [Methanocella conradii]AFC99126.1 hypothetical protein Mtc_0356 [Methanocella conradii HZ254]MDI6896628.1 hypothetical protein [Methanocella conradii]
MRAALFLAAIAAMFMICGCVGGMGTIEYMGLKYGSSTHDVASADKLYYTGETWGGAKLYAPGWESPGKVPSLLFTSDAAGYHAFSKPAVGIYAYSLYAHYNLGEPVTIGLMNEAAGKVDLKNAAPWEIQALQGGAWKTIYQPVAAQVITTLENGTYREWTWDQRDNGGEAVCAGEYRVAIDGKYMAYFNITPGSPVVRAEATDYDNKTLRDTFWDAKEHKAFGEHYKEYADEARRDVEGQMLFKAWMKGLDPDKLQSALKTARDNASTLNMLPCLAVHASYGGQPCWIIVYNWGMANESPGHIRYYVVDDAAGKIIQFETCR